MTEIERKIHELKEALDEAENSALSCFACICESGDLMNSRPREMALRMLDYGKELQEAISAYDSILHDIRLLEGVIGIEESQSPIQRNRMLA